MAVEQETIIRFTCDLCGASQVTTPEPFGEKLICNASASAKIEANVQHGDELRRMTIRMELCDQCYVVFAGLVAGLRTRLKAAREASIPPPPPPKP